MPSILLPLPWPRRLPPPGARAAWGRGGVKDSPIAHIWVRVTLRQFAVQRTFAPFLMVRAQP